MTPDEFRLRCAAIVCTLTLLNKQVTGRSFPSFDDAVVLEVANVLSLPSLTQDQDYRRAIPKELQIEITREPWSKTMDTTELIDRVIEQLDGAGYLDSTYRIMSGVFDTDPTVYSVIRRGLQPIKNADIVVDAVDACGRVFSVEYDDLEGPVRALYYGLFQRLL